MQPPIGMEIDRHGVWFALAAYGAWGIAPVYFKFLDFADPTEVANRK